MAAMGSEEVSSTQSYYHVFLSFRGIDTRTTFSDHLHTALLNAGIRTFRDDDELERGDHIASELIKAIDESRISIIVFSKDYASSTWCLNELLRMLERRSVGHLIVPVFYHVDPSDLRWLKGSFGDAFVKHEERLKSKSDEEKEEGMVKIRSWRKALEEVADLLAHVLGKDEHESDFIQKIIKDIGNKLSRTVLSVCRYPVGLDFRIKSINLWLQDESSKVSIMAIYGMRGIGKTTIAKILYNLNFDKFEGSSFLAVRETLQQNGLVGLQSQLLSNILKGREVKISTDHEGNKMIEEALSSKRVLLVLDDVDHVDQSEAVLGLRYWIKQGSKIIITSTNEQLLDARELYKIHRVTKLNDDESLQLFSWHAFGQYHPSEACKDYSKKVVKYCEGLPLALEVLGSSLSKKNADIWEVAINKLEAVLHRKITEKLKISFDLLEDDYDRKIFLDIACFFVGKNKDLVIKVLDACELYPIVGIDNLIKRCLLTVDNDWSKKLRMHRLLQEMGRKIVRPPESPMDPWKGSRLWHHKDALNVLRKKIGTEVVEGLTLNLHRSISSEQSGQGFSSSKRLRLSIFSWIPRTSASTESSSTSNEVDLQTDAFSSMHNLRLLQLNNVRLTGSYEQFPKELRWLCWCWFPLKIIPSEFSLEILVVLEMKCSSLKLVWKGKKSLRSLKILNLSHSHDLTETPDFSNVPNLESLILEDCITLMKVHESIGELKRLVLLNLKDCKNLRNLPSEIGQLKLLENFILAGCSKLVELPKEMREMESLKYFNADGIGINQLPSTSSDIISWGFRLIKSPESIGFPLDCFPRSLVRLSLANNKLSDGAILRDLGRLSLLQHLNLRGNPICSLPEIIKCLTMLQTLNLEECTKLQLLPELPMSLQELELNQCRSLEIITNLPNLFSSPESDNLILSMIACKKVVEVKKLFRLEPIRNIDAEIIKNLDLVELESMEEVKVILRNNLTHCRMICPIQGLYEFGIFSIYLPGNEVPAWYRNKTTTSSICFNVPSLPNNLKIRGLNVCVVYDFHGSRDFHGFLYEFIMRTFNKTKDVKWTYYPTLTGFPDEGENMIWVSHWKLGNQIEAGDEVDVTVDLWHQYEVKELGVHIVYEQEEKEKDTQHNTYTSFPDDVFDGADLPSHVVTTSSHSHFYTYMEADMLLDFMQKPSFRQHNNLKSLM